MFYICEKASSKCGHCTHNNIHEYSLLDGIVDYRQEHECYFHKSVRCVPISTLKNVVRITNTPNKIGQFELELPMDAQIIPHAFIDRDKIIISYMTTNLPNSVTSNRKFRIIKPEGTLPTQVNLISVIERGICEEPLYLFEIFK